MALLCCCLSSFSFFFFLSSFFFPIFVCFLPTLFLHFIPFHPHHSLLFVIYVSSTLSQSLDLIGFLYLVTSNRRACVFRGPAERPPATAGRS